MGSMLGPNRFIAKDVKSSTFTAAMYMREINSMSRGNALAQNRRNQYHAQLGLPDKGRAIKGLVVCNSWDLEPLDLLNGLALAYYQPSPEV